MARREVAALRDKASVKEIDQIDYLDGDLDTVEEELKASQRVSAEQDADIQETLANVAARVAKLRKEQETRKSSESSQAALEELGADVESTDLPVALRRRGYEALAGVKVSEKVEIDGQEGTLELDARAAMREFDERAAAIQKLRGCLKGQ